MLYSTGKMFNVYGSFDFICISPPKNIRSIFEVDWNSRILCAEIMWTVYSSISTSYWWAERSCKTFSFPFWNFLGQMHSRQQTCGLTYFQTFHLCVWGTLKVIWLNWFMSHEVTETEHCTESQSEASTEEGHDSLSVGSFEEGFKIRIHPRSPQTKTASLV